jgi:hypothetical protein
MTEIDKLSHKELELFDHVISLDGTIEHKLEILIKHNIFNEYAKVHKAYLKLFFVEVDEKVKLEILKRLTFLNWISMLEPSFLTGIADLDNLVIFDSYSILDHYLKAGKIDWELKWMLSFYSNWDYILLSQTENKLEQITDFMKAVDNSITHIPTYLPKETMANRGQMGIYWNGYLVKT